MPIGGPAGHSILIAVFPQRKTITLYDSWQPKNASRARRVASDLCSFLGVYLQELWVEEEWKIGFAKGPWQSNGVDCGVWVCANAWKIVCGLAYTGMGNSGDAWAMRKRMAAEIANGGLLIEDPVSRTANMCYRVHDGVESRGLDAVSVKSATRVLHEGKARKCMSLENFRRWISGIRVTLNSPLFRA